MDPLLLTGLAFVLGGLGAVAPAQVLVVGLCVGALLVRRVGVAAVLVAFALSALGLVRARLAIDGFEGTRAEVRDALGPPARCAGRAVVVQSPTWRGDALRAVVELQHVDCEGRPLPGRPRAVLYGGAPDLARGDTLEVVAQLAPLRTFDNPGLPDPTPGAARRGTVLSGGVLAATVVARGTGLRWRIDRARAAVRARIAATFAPQAAPMARALVLGETDLDAGDDEAFRKSGLAHLLAVSGTHLVFAVVALVRGLRAVLARLPPLARRVEVGRVAAGVGIALSLIYADFAGGTGSAWRAAFMLSAACVARALGRRPRGARALGLSFFIGAAVDPLAAFDLSFLLSAAATAGLMGIAQPVLRSPVLSKRSRALGWLVESAVATVASMIPCVPLLALMASELTVAGIAANVLAAPIGEVAALPICLLHGISAPWPALERGLALVGSGALLVVRQIAHASANTTWLAFDVPLPTAGQTAALVVAGAALVALRRRALVAAALALILIALEFAHRAETRPVGRLRVTALDVGQGDATLVDLPDGRLMLIDAGGFVGSPVDPGAQVVLPMLRARRRTRIDVVVLSHPHPDHFGGLLSVIDGVAVGELWDTGQGQAEGAGPDYTRLLARARARGVRLRRPAELCGQHRGFAGLGELSVLAPCPGFVPHRPANDNSFVLRLVHGARAALLTGDAEAELEHELLARRVRLRADLLKVGHHGSRTSTTAPFLAAVAPQLATMSCGVRNRFGHPHAVTVTRLAHAGVHALRLDRSGGVVWETDGHAAHWLSARAGGGVLH